MNLGIGPRVGRLAADERKLGVRVAVGVVRAHDSAGDFILDDVRAAGGSQAVPCDSDTIRAERRFHAGDRLGSSRSALLLLDPISITW